jgi:chemotaxis protein CheZ
MRDAASAVSPAAALQAKLAELQAREPVAEPRMVAEVVRAVLAAMQGDLSSRETSLLSEVEELGRTIASAKAEIAALRVDDINESHIPLATDELDAIIAHTAAATDSILEVCETLDTVGGELAADTTSARCVQAAAQLQDATTRIYEACGFQDITGQRITKVVAALKLIEGKVAHMVTTFSVRSPVAPPVNADVELDAEAMLLNGPQLPAAAMDQTDIDKLLASFD